jgi:DNA-binding MarR family transcriptional regulator
MMTPELLSGTVLDAWQRLLRSHALIIRLLDAELHAAHGMTLSDYDVLVNLRDASESEQDCIKMSDLSQKTLLTRSGMTRLVQGLEREGLVERAACASDARVSYTRITPLGLERLAAARETHHAGIERLFASHFTCEEISTLNELLGKIPGTCAEAPPCSGELATDA